MKENCKFLDLESINLMEVNGGGVAGFIAGYFLGSVAGFVAAPVMAACGATQSECEQVFLSCIAIGSALGSVTTGPV